MDKTRHRLTSRCDAVLLILVALLTAGSLVASAPEALAQNPKWAQLPPPPLAGRAYAYDSKRNRMLVVGPSIWALNLTDPPQWQDLEVTSNPNVAQGALVYDSLRDRLIAHQYRISGTSMSWPHQVWTLDLSASPLQWLRMSDGGTAPYPVCCMAMVYDPVRDRVLAFAGSAGIGEEQAGVSSLSLSTNTWSGVSTSGVPPTGRSYPTLVYDPQQDRVLAYGGVVYGPTTTFFDETWSLSLSGTPTWTFLTPTQFVAFARARHVAVIDPVGRRMIVAGGGGNGISDDTWALDLDAPTGDAVWTQLAPAPAARPPARSQEAACYDPLHHRMLLYGGYQALGPGADLWSLDLAGTPAWTLPAGGIDPPPLMSGHVTFIDPAANQVYASLGTGPDASTWVRSLAQNANWKRVQTTGPSARRGSVAVTDGVGGQAIVFGGEQGSDPVDETWSYDLSTSAWSLLSPGARPSPRSDALGVFDPSRRKLILYGGRGRTPTGRPRALADTWSYDGATGRWTLLSVGGMGGRWDMVGAYDPARDRIVAFGGRDTTDRLSDAFVLPFSPSGPWAPLATMGTAPLTLLSGSLGAAYDLSRGPASRGRLPRQSPGVVAFIQRHTGLDDACGKWSTSSICGGVRDLT